MSDFAQYRRRKLVVDAIRVTKENMAEVAQLCNGTIRDDGVVRPGYYIWVPVSEDPNRAPRRVRAFPGDWVTRIPSHFKVYTNENFSKLFEPIQTDSDKFNAVFSQVMKAMAIQDSATYHEDYAGVDLAAQKIAADIMNIFQ